MLGQWSQPPIPEVVESSGASGPCHQWGTLYWVFASGVLPSCPRVEAYFIKVFCSCVTLMLFAFNLFYVPSEPHFHPPFLFLIMTLLCRMFWFLRKRSLLATFSLTGIVFFVVLLNTNKPLVPQIPSFGKIKPLLFSFNRFL